MTESATLHEPAVKLSGETIELHRALVSLQEELEAVDWYRQRADACEDAELQAILLHNMREEMEHAAMLVEWLRRNQPDFDHQLATYLNGRGPITELEEAAESGGPDSDPERDAPEPDVEAFTVGNLKE